MIAEMSDMSVSMTFKTRKLVLQLQLRVSNGMMTVESTRLAKGGCLRNIYRWIWINGYVFADEALHGQGGVDPGCNDDCQPPLMIRELASNQIFGEAR